MWWYVKGGLTQLSEQQRSFKGGGGDGGLIREEEEGSPLEWCSWDHTVFLTFLDELLCAWNPSRYWGIVVDK